MKNGRFFGKDYFRELLERVRFIRASERHIYQQINDIFAESVNRFLEFNEYKILESYGSVSRKKAEENAFAEYDKFNKTQRIESDFDKAVKQLEASKKKGGNHE